MLTRFLRVPLLPNLGLFLCCSLLGSGCESEVHRVSGTVTFQNAPLQSGSVSAYQRKTAESTDWAVVGSSAIGPNGTYVIENISAGEVRFVVMSHLRTPAGLGGGRESEVPKLPEKYETHSESGLQCVIEQEDTIYDIKLTAP